MPQTVVNALTNLGIGAALGIIPLVYGLIKKQKIFAIASIVMCSVFFLMMGWISVLYMALCVFLIYRNDKKMQELLAKKKRIQEEAKVRRQEEEHEPGYIPPASKTRNVWPPIENNIYDEEAAREYQETYGDQDGGDSRS